MYCKNCGAYNPEGSRFCSNCNAKLMESQNEVTKKLVSNNNVLNKTPVWVYFIIGILIIGIAIVSYNIYLLTNEKSNQNLISNNDQSNYSTDSSTLNNNQDESTVYYQENSSSSNKSSSSNSNSSSKSSSSSTTSLNNQYTPTSGIHSYKVCMGDITWNEAVRQASSMGGYLAHIDSESEFNEVISQIRSYRNTTGKKAGEYYIGGKRDSNNSSYYWTDQNGDMYGDAINNKLENWFFMEGEPSFYDNDSPETVLTILSLNDGSSFVGNDSYQDISSANPRLKGKVGYIVEFEN